MSLLKFELKKLIRQQKLIWLLVSVVIIVSWLFYQNYSSQDLRVKEAIQQVDSLAVEADQLYADLLPLEREHQLSEEQQRQFDSLNDMASAIFHWRSAIYEKRWEEIPQIEQNFLTSLSAYADAGGTYSALKELEREKAVDKNAYLVERQLPSANETYPVSPALLLNQVSRILFGPMGLLLLVLLFGTSYTAEKEQRTLLLLRTQPIRRGTLLTAKYVVLIAVTGLFATLVTVSSWTAPFIFGDTFNDLQYPLVLQSGASFVIIPVWQHLLEHTILFAGSAMLVVALLILLGTQLQSSFSSILLTGLTSMIGYVLTGSYRILQSPLNPFQLFRGNEILATPSDHPIILYAVSAILWSMGMLLLAMWLREGDRGLSKSASELKPFYEGQVRHLRPFRMITLFEWRKSKRQGLLSQCLLVLLIAVVGGYFFLAHQVKEKESAALDVLAATTTRADQENIPYFEGKIREFQELIKKANEKGDDGEAIYAHNIPLYEELIESAREEADLAEQASAAFEKGEWGPVYDHQLYVERWIEDFRESNSSIGPPLTYFGYEAGMARTKWMQEHNMRPIFTGHYIPNIHDRWEPENRNEQASFEEGNREADHSGLFMLFMVFRDYLFIIPLVLLLYLTGAGFAGERGKRPTLRLLTTLPISRGSLFLGKVLNASVVAIISAVGLFLFTVLIGTIFNRFGDWMYPILRYHSKQEVQSFDYTGLRAFEGGYDFLPLGEYVLQALLLYVCITLFLVALTNSIGLFIRQPLVVYLLTALLSIGGCLLSGQAETLAPYSPFLYLNLPKILNGELLALLNNPAITVSTGCAVLLGASLLLIAVVSSILRSKLRTKNEKTLAAKV